MINIYASDVFADDFIDPEELGNSFVDENNVNKVMPKLRSASWTDYDEHLKNAYIMESNELTGVFDSIESDTEAITGIVFRFKPNSRKRVNVKVHEYKRGNFHLIID
jgi:hypothetical protein